MTEGEKKPAQGSGDATDKPKRNPALAAIVAVGSVLGFVVLLLSNLNELVNLRDKYMPDPDAQLRREFHSEADETIGGKWKKNCVFNVPERWMLSWDDMNNTGSIMPPTGSALDQAGFQVSISDSPGAVGEAVFFNKEMAAGTYQRGHVLTLSDYLAAYASFEPETVAAEKAKSTLLSSANLHLLVQYEDGSEIVSEPVEIWKTITGPKVASYSLNAMIRPTTAQEEMDREHFTGYRSMVCGANSVVNVRDFTRLCAAVIEATTRVRLWDGNATECNATPAEGNKEEAEEGE